MEWISVKDKLPDFNKEVLVFGEIKGSPSMGGAYITISKRIDLKGTVLEGSNYLCEHSFKNMSYVKYWQPLPLAPSQKE